jgi:hypothetical protein
MMHGRGRRIFISTVIAALLSTVAVGTASATETRPNVFSFGPSGTNTPDKFVVEPLSVEYNQALKTLYVLNLRTGPNRKIYRFDASELLPSPKYTPLSPIPVPLAGGEPDIASDQTVAPSPTAGNLYYESESSQAVFGFDASGNALAPPLKEILPSSPRDLTGVAVDPSGYIWVGDWSAQKVRKYDPATGEEVASIDTSSLGRPAHPAFDSNGDMFLSMYFGPLYKLTASSNYDPAQAEEIDSGTVKDVAVDRTTHTVYAVHAFGENAGVSAYDSATGSHLYDFAGNIPGEEPLSVAVDEANNRVFVSDNGNDLVRVFGPLTIVPTVTVIGTSNTTRTSTDIEATVELDGGGDATECVVEYGLTTSYEGGAVPCNKATPITTDGPVTAHLSGLEAQTTYHYRLKVANEHGPNYSGDHTFTTDEYVLETETLPADEITWTEATLNGSFNADGMSTNYYFEYGPTTAYGTNVPLPAPPGADGGSASVVTAVSQSITGLEPGTSPEGQEYDYRLVAENTLGTTFGENQVFHTVPAVKQVATLPATSIKHDAVTLNGSFDPNGETTHYYFEWGLTGAYEHYAPVPPPGVDGGEAPGPMAVSTVLGNLEAGLTYHYRLVATNSHGTTQGADETVIPTEQPSIRNDRVSQVNTDHAQLEALVNPNALETTYHWEYGTEDCSVTECEETAASSIGSGPDDVRITYALEGLTPGKTYYFRLVSVNSRGEVKGEDHSFVTYTAESGVDTCPNVLVRKQTGAAPTRHCRAYELVSAANTGGYDVESNLISGLHPMPGFPNADGKVLYTVRFGSIPGSGNPPNKGGDPYVATRGAEGWTTAYVGLQANGTESVDPFASTLLEADQRLDSFAIGGPEICAPCFPDGSANIPLRLPNGELVKGMAGDENPAADPAGEITRHFSADGSHFVFGSTAKFEPSGNSGSLSIYERDLSADTTRVVSTMPDGSTMPGPGTAELDISSDGSRVLIGRQVGTDATGNPEYDLYMHIGDDPKSVLIADPAGGVLYAGMNADGSRVYFTTDDPLTEDGDTSADLYRADVSASGATVTRVSTGTAGTGDGDGCDPVANSGGNHWNEPGPASAATCGVVAIGGGGGVAADNGTVYFLSPELLAGAGKGVADQPNLYAAAPGSAPVFVATLEPDNPAVRDAVGDAAGRETADFQVTPDGRYSVFASRLRLTEATTGGFYEIYRTDLSGPIECASCAPSNAAPSSDTNLTAGGLNLANDGRVFFTSSEQLILRDTNQLKDAYEWDEGQTALISTGLDTSDSALLTASSDGSDVFFFTRQTLAPQDENGGAMKIYDAREGGGFLYNPPPRECVASDECHGPGTQQAPPPPINTIEGTGVSQPALVQEKQNAKRCRKGFVKRQGKCVKSRKQQKKHKRHVRGKEQHRG